ncbi:cytochrome P450 monooxygenase-like protein [Daldinia caldariorum]|uniref:cytochrome P450 monooxygenase-like protein n=1 Tax=Daldinia caldariorum TaxID=326644 RepID=UPI00200799CA|nr:cytochrome P450 monooxygenase-like protein [Daldinia caldariorum]KAI1472489.1 cytochrome P450 monooxygenase-like protein [Daldinia caldariorum]
MMFDLYLTRTSIEVWLLVLLSLGSLLLLTKTLYNLFFHPLSHVPGPFWSRISGLPAWYHTCRGNRHIWLWQQFQIYGDRVRVDPHTVLFCDSQSYADIYSMNSNVKRGPFYEMFQNNSHESMITTVIDVAEHARRRKIVKLAFTDKSIRAASTFVISHVERWIQLMMKDNDRTTEWSSPIDFSEPAHALTFDIMSELNFGASSDIKEPGENPLKLIPYYIDQYLKFHYKMARIPFPGFLLWLKPLGFNYFLDFLAPPAVQKFYQFINNSMTDRIALQKEQAKDLEAYRRQDTFYFLYEARDPDTGGPAYNDAALRGEAGFFMIAGTDTTATALCSIMFYLTGDPRRYQKLVDEILSTFESAEDIVYGPKLLGCKYLKACIDEGMRLGPSVPSDLPRRVLPGGLTIKGEYYPEGTVVGSVPWAMMRNQEVYGDPEVFRPERWILDESTGVTQEGIAQAKACFHPFLSGSFSCLGQNLALAIIFVTVARLLYHLDMRRVPGSTFGGGSPEKGWGARNINQLQLEDISGAASQGPEVQFKRRAFVS